MTESQDSLVAWVRSVSEADVSFAPPTAEPGDGQRVGVYLLELRGEIALSPARPDFRQLELSYLVTASADEPATAEALLIDLCFAAMEQPGMDVDLAPPDVALWEALGVAPRPSFRVNVPMRRRIREPEVRPVLRPLVVETAPLSSIAGVVRTADETPVPDARVEIADLNRAAVTDRRGRFQLHGVPTGRRPIRIRVTARGRQVERDVTGREDRSSVVITVNPTEAVNG